MGAAINEVFRKNRRRVSFIDYDSNPKKRDHQAFQPQILLFVILLQSMLQD
tara:strand:- start:453 stop:605 length:153 start_codon:yes stop_codon:yes gene_type:complete